MKFRIASSFQQFLPRPRATTRKDAGRDDEFGELGPRLSLPQTQSVPQLLRNSSWHRALLAILAAAPILTLAGCAGIVSAGGSKSSPPQGSIQVSPTNLSFGNITVGKKISQIATVANTGSISVNISQASLSSGQFAITGLTMPMTLSAGTSSTFQVWFEPTAAGSASGTLALQTDSGISSEQVPVTGAATAAPQQISLSTTNLSLGNAVVGSTVKGTLAIKNVGGASLIISLISVTGNPFGVSGITTPDTIAPGGSATLNVSFTPAATGTDSGTMTITCNDPQTPASVVTLAGTGTSAAVAPTITTQPVNQAVTAGQTAIFTVAAGGTATLSYQWQKNGANIAGATGTNYTTPATATTDSGSTFRVVVTNTAGSVMSSAATLTVSAATVA
ncbi:MAG: choice-of-anchor D domain-containing protein, partial [Candidatus Acidiferrum sp.]